MTSEEKLKEIIASAVGPAPWSWETFPRPTGVSGKRYEWRFHPQGSELAYLVTLHLPGELDKPRLALNTYCRPFLINSDAFGVWCPEGRNLRFVAFDPDSLKAFEFIEIAGWFKNSSERMYAATAPIAEFSIPTTMPAGTNEFKFPEEFQPVRELLTVTALPSTAADEASAAVFVLYPHAGLVEVLPQKWFTPRKFDLGYQWITRVSRDPESHHIIGDGIRMGSFELNDEGTGLLRWIEMKV
ncbi:MAG: hypothetical protein ACM3JB_21570 [Acidobacteriaceae bacterium]